MKYDNIKYILDFLFALAVIPLLLVLGFFIAIGLKIDSPKEKIFFIQDRVGRDSKLFQLYKFRSMKSVGNPGKDFTKINDNRITRLGHFLRLFRLDELPQFINILKGEMSLIGPRPEQPHFVESLAKKYGDQFHKRHSVLPGITGLAQVKIGYVADFTSYAKKLDYDLEYIRKKSFITDCKIFFATFKTLFLNIGAR